METAQKYLQNPKGRTKKTTIFSSKQRLNQESSLMRMISKSESTDDANPHKLGTFGLRPFWDNQWMIPSEGPFLSLVRMCISVF